MTTLGGGAPCPLEPPFQGATANRTSNMGWSSPRSCGTSPCATTLDGREANIVVKAKKILRERPMYAKSMTRTRPPCGLDDDLNGRRRSRPPRRNRGRRRIVACPPGPSSPPRRAARRGPAEGVRPSGRAPAARRASSSSRFQLIDAIVVAPSGWEEPAILLAEEVRPAARCWCVCPRPGRRAPIPWAAEVPDNVPSALVHDTPWSQHGGSSASSPRSRLGAEYGLPLADTVKRVRDRLILETVDLPPLGRSRPAGLPSPAAQPLLATGASRPATAQLYRGAEAATVITVIPATAGCSRGPGRTWTSATWLIGGPRARAVASTPDTARAPAWSSSTTTCTARARPVDPALQRSEPFVHQPRVRRVSLRPSTVPTSRLLQTERCVSDLDALAVLEACP